MTPLFVQVTEAAHMTQPPVDQLINRRANAMAHVLLSSRSDLIVADGEKALGVDLVISIVKPDRYSFRQFGVILLGHVESFESADLAGEIMETHLRDHQSTEGVVTPVCVFLFNMTGDLGYFAWLFEPLKTKQGPKLRRADKLVCQVLDQKSIDLIVRRVNEYYDALALTLIAS